MINFTNCIRQNEKLHSISREIHKKIIKGGGIFFQNILQRNFIKMLLDDL